MLGSETRDQHGSPFKGIRYLLAPCRMLRLHLIIKPDLDHVAVILLADAGKQMGVARPTR